MINYLFKDIIGENATINDLDSKDSIENADNLPSSVQVKIEESE